MLFHYPKLLFSFNWTQHNVHKTKQQKKEADLNKNPYQEENKLI